MSEPQPLHESCESELERALLSAGLEYGASDRARSNTLTALGVGKTTARRGHSLLIAFAAGAALVAIVSGGAVAAYRVSRAALTQRVTAVPAAYAPALPNPSRSPRVVHPSEPAPAVSDNPVGETVVAPAPEPSAPPAALKLAPRGGAGRALLGDELAALDGAAAAIAAGHVRRGIALLDAYRRDYPHGRLGLEAEVLRIDALAQSGDPNAAARAAERFLKRHADSVLAARVRRYLRD